MRTLFLAGIILLVSAFVVLPSTRANDSVCSTLTLWDGWKPVMDIDYAASAEVARRYYTWWGPDVSGSVDGAAGVGGLVEILEYAGSSTLVSLPIYDGLGNVVGLIDAASGASVATYQYGPWGEVLGVYGPRAASCPFRYQTRLYDDETGLYYCVLRYLDAKAHVWLSRDPMREAGGVNLYAYCEKDPVGKHDPIGLDPAFAPGIGIWGGLTAKEKVEASEMLTGVAAYRENKQMFEGNAYKAAVATWNPAYIALRGTTEWWNGMGLQPGNLGTDLGKWERRFSLGEGVLGAVGTVGVGFDLGVGSVRGGSWLLSATTDSTLSIRSASGAFAGDALTPLTNRQASILEKLATSRSSVLLRKSEINLNDLAALTARTGDEFGMFTLAGRRLVYRGTSTNLGLSEKQIFKLALDQFRFSGHTHPGVSMTVLEPSVGDRKVLQLFQEMGTQQRSVIFNSNGESKVFTPSVFDDMFGF